LNDPSCCPINNPIDRPAIYLTTNSWPINIIESCFSWKITSVCGDVIGEISEKACHAANMDCGPVGDFETPQNKKEEEEKDEVLIDQGVKIYPNPVTDDKLMFSLGNVLVSDKIRIEIYSIDGRKILSKDFIGNSEDQINISTLTSGLYIVRVLQNNHQIHTDKFEKQ
jgi:hypothetical protein